MSVVSFEKAKLERGSHMCGYARCLACQHEWSAVAPIGTVWLECPSCSLDRGRYAGPALRDDEVWHCLCGCDLFYATPDGFYCPNCGEWQ